jgi:hypothetical protein
VPFCSFLRTCLTTQKPWRGTDGFNCIVVTQTPGSALQARSPRTYLCHCGRRVSPCQPNRMSPVTMLCSFRVSRCWKGDLSQVFEGCTRSHSTSLPTALQRLLLLHERSAPSTTSPCTSLIRSEFTLLGTCMDVRVVVPAHTMQRSMYTRFEYEGKLCVHLPSRQCHQGCFRSCAKIVCLSCCIFS